TRISNGLKRPPCGLGRHSQGHLRRVQTDLCVGMIVQGKQLSPLIALACFQFVLDGHHFVEQAIELCVLASEKCLVLFDSDGGETLDELIHRHILELGALHGFRTPCRTKALRPTLVRSSQSFPRRYSLGESPSYSIFFVIYQPVISQCLNRGTSTRFSG